jgi:hypothetical protein
VLVESSPSGFLDGIHDQKQIGIQGTLDLLAGFARAVLSLSGANRADVAADGFDVLLDIVALDRLDGLGHLGKEAEEGAPGGFLQAALTLYSALSANVADSVADQNLEFC